ncbi:MAG: N-acetylmuramoyl-L-alanine amidase [Gammaproteobacteria bacterium]|nr:N-acetylmuramoyl-L-alanine amidase [Gammaproteobacteria bacterium]
MQRSRFKHYLVFITIVFFYLDSTSVLSEETNDNELQKIQTFQSESFSTRIRFVVIHYTSIDWENSLKVLTNERYEVSSHYLIPEGGDDTYSDQIKIFQLVDEENRAWHAGISKWEERTNINDQSIGIELVNQAECSVRQGSQYDYTNNYICLFSEFDSDQIDQLILLLKDILSRHDEIKPTYIVGHSDISPDRKFDPGPKFPWKKLYENGIGAWYDDQTFEKYKNQFKRKIPDINQIQCALKRYGYGVEITNKMDEQTFFVIRAFQYHFTPNKSDGSISVDTVSALWALLEKYFPETIKNDSLVECKDN